MVCELLYLVCTAMLYTSSTSWWSIKMNAGEPLLKQCVGWVSAAQGSSACFLELVIRSPMTWPMSTWSRAEHHLPCNYIYRSVRTRNSEPFACTFLTPCADVVFRLYKTHEDVFLNGSKNRFTSDVHAKYVYRHGYVGAVNGKTWYPFDVGDNIVTSLQPERCKILQRIGLHTVAILMITTWTRRTLRLTQVTVHRSISMWVQ